MQSLSEVLCPCQNDPDGCRDGTLISTEEANCLREAYAQHEIQGYLDCEHEAEVEFTECLRPDACSFESEECDFRFSSSIRSCPVISDEALRALDDCRRF